MNTKTIYSLLCSLMLLVGLTACDNEKELIIIDGNLPIKTSTLYLVGDATPNGWSIDSPTPLTAGEEDPLVFTWEGPLNPGEMKLCLTTGSWDAPFIRPAHAGETLGRSGIAETAFAMHAGDPDDKWKVTEAGIYSLRFDLRNWKMQADFVREPDAPVIEPIATENLYIVGEATPNGWNIDEPTALEKTSDYIFVYEGPLATGEFKACTETGSWDVPFVRPASNGCKVDKDGVENESFVYTTGPDNKWIVEQAGIYRLTFDLENYTIAAEYTGDFTPRAKLYIIGEATEGGWSWDAATEILATEDNNSLFIWEGELGRGTFKASQVKDFGAPFYRPETPNCEVSANGVASNRMVFTDSPDDQWLVTTAGTYRLTFDIEAMTINAEFLSGEVAPASLFMIGEATEGGWSLDNATEVPLASDGLYVWEGALKEGTFKACVTKDFSAPFYRPAVADVEVSANGVADHRMVFTTDPDDQWKVVKNGRYRLSFNTTEMTFDAVCLEAEPDVPEPPAELPALYMIGDATTGGWSLDNATEITAGSDGLHIWEGVLNTGTFKACGTKDFSAPFYRPAIADVEVSANGVADHRMVFTTDPDDKWKVTTAGRYRLTFNTQAMTFDATFIEPVAIPDPLYILGDATPGGWSQDDAEQMTPVDGSDGVYTWTGTLKQGTMKAFTEKDPTWSQNFYRPTHNGVEISRNGVAEAAMVFTASPDDQWKIVDAGRYRLTLNIKAMTIEAKYLD